MTFPKLGNLAPTFSLPNQRGETVALKDFCERKVVVLYFYPKAMTPGCTVQACGLRDTGAEYAALDTVVLGVSPDPVARLVKFAERDRLDFDLLSDVDHAVAERYGVWGLKKFMGREFMGIRRTTFVIGRDGRLRQIFDKVRTASHHQDMLAWLRSNPG